MRHKPGNIFSIDIGDGSYCFGRSLESPLMAFYNLRTLKIPSLEFIVTQSVLFKICVREKEGLRSGRWEVLGNIELGANDLLPVSFFKQDIYDPSKISIYMSNSRGEETPTTIDQAIGLENVAVWESQHVEERLLDYFHNRPNKWVESLKPKHAKKSVR